MKERSIRMKRSTYEKKLRNVKDVITNYVINNDVDIYNTAYIMTYLSGYMPDVPIGVCMDAIIQIREEQFKGIW